MFLSRLFLALTVYIPLLVHCSPTVLSHYRLPPALGPQKLRLIRQNAINISSHRFVYAQHPCIRSSQLPQQLTNDT
jgi:hypothetical protein